MCYMLIKRIYISWLHLKALLEIWKPKHSVNDFKWFLEKKISLFREMMSKHVDDF